MARDDDNEQFLLIFMCTTCSRCSNNWNTYLYPATIFPGIYESPTLQNIHTQPQATNIELESSSPAPEPSTPDSADDFEQKSMTSIMFKLEGMSVTLYTDNGKEVSTDYLKVVFIDAV